MNTTIANATEYRDLPLAMLTESTTNPRRIFEDLALKELAESIRTQGVLSPLLVRPLNEQGFEIVAGARRYRAAQMAEAATIPVRIVHLTDAETLEADALRRMFEEVSLGAPENAIGFILWRITSRYQREMDRALVAVDLSHLQFVTLALVGWFERSGTVATQIELSRFGGIHPMQLSQMLKTLEAKQFIVRRRDTADSRAKQVALTRKGFGTLRKALPQAIKVQSRLFGETGAKGSVLLKELLQLDFHLSTTIGREPETPSVIRQHKS